MYKNTMGICTSHDEKTEEDPRENIQIEPPMGTRQDYYVILLRDIVKDILMARVSPARSPCKKHLAHP